MKHDMRIIDEDVVKDAHHIYEIIIVEKGKDVSYTKEELIFGPVLMKKKDPLFIEKWQKQLVSQSNILKGLPQTNEKYQEVKDMVDLIKKVIE
jgi:tRNA (adenine22-N1)-methyltransferase